MQEHSTTDLTNICYDVTKQRSLFLCIFGSCQSRYYGPALASAIISCSGRGANISPLLPVEIQSEKLSGRQISEDSGDSGSISSSDINNEGIDHKLTLALSCNAGSDGVVTVSLSSPPTFATHIPDAARFPDDLLSRLGLGGSSTSVATKADRLDSVGKPGLCLQWGWTYVLFDNFGFVFSYLYKFLHDYLHSFNNVARIGQELQQS
ncbi:hypothetical protein NHJ6243_009321 [Beauveria neobassiana]